MTETPAATLRAAAVSQWVVQVDWSRPPLPRLVGPFASREDATAWMGRQHLIEAEWNLAPLVPPTPSPSGSNAGGGQ